MKIVKVMWLDAQAMEAGLMTLKAAKLVRPVICETIGFLIDDNDECLMLCSELWPSEMHIKYLNMIPKGMIKKIEVIKEDGGVVE